MMLSVVEWLTVLQVNNLSNFWPADTAEMSQALYNTLHGEWFQQTLNREGYNALAFHGWITPILQLPLYALYPQGLLICLVKNFLMILSIVPIYALTRAWFSKSAERLGLTLLYALGPCFLGMLFCETHLQLFALPGVVASAYYYVVGRFRPFVACMVLVILTKESFCFLYIAWAMLAAYERKGARWWAWCLAWGAGWFLVYHYLKEWVFVPGSRTKLNLFEYYYGNWGSSMGECVWNILLNPMTVLTALFEISKWFYLFYVVFPFLPFLFLRPRWFLLALPSLGIVFLMTGRGTEIYNGSLWPYYTETMVFAFVAFLDFARSMSTAVGRERIERIAWIGLVILMLLAMWMRREWFNPFMSEVTLLQMDHGPFVLVEVLSLLLLMGLQFISPRNSKTILFLAILVLLQLAVFHLAMRVGRRYMHPSCFSSYFFVKVSPEQRKRNRIARDLLESLPKDKSLAVPLEYALVASNRSRLYLYDGMKPVEMAGDFDYVLVDLVCFTGSSVITDSWKGSYIGNLILDGQKRWELKFYYDHLYLFQRRRSMTSLP